MMRAALIALLLTSCGEQRPQSGAEAEESADPEAADPKTPAEPAPLAPQAEAAGATDDEAETAASAEPPLDEAAAREELERSQQILKAREGAEAKRRQASGQTPEGRAERPPQPRRELDAEEAARLRKLKQKKQLMRDRAEDSFGL